MKERIVAILMISLLLAFSMISGCLDLDDDIKSEDDDQTDDPKVDITIPDSTIQLDEEVLDSVRSVSDDASEIVFEGSDTDLSNIEEGNVLSLGVGEKTPHGLLRKVVSIERSGTTTTLVTDQATIEDALEEGRVEYNQNISDPVKTIESVDGVEVQNGLTRSGDDGITFHDVLLYRSTDGGSITLNGFLDMDFDLIFTLELEDFKITECRFGSRTTFNGELDITSDRDMEFKVEVEVARFEFTPIIIPMGALEIVIVPVLSLVIGSQGTVSSGLSVASEQNTILDVFVEHPDWEPQKDFTSNFGHSTPTLLQNTSVVCYAGPEMALLLWGVAGPYITAHAYVNGESDQDGTWWIYSGLSFGLGFKIEVLGTTIEEWENPDIIDFRRLVATSMDDLAGEWVLEKLDFAVQLTRPVLINGPDGGLVMVYHSIDPETGYLPIRLAILKDGTWSFEELVYSNDYDMMDLAVDADGHIHLVYYDGGFRPSLEHVEWDGTSMIRSGFRDPDMAGRYVSELKMVIDEDGNPNIYYVLKKNTGANSFYDFTHAIFKRAVLADDVFTNETIIDEEELSITGLDLVKGTDGSTHMTYMKVSLGAHAQILVHSIFSDDTWSNMTVFQEEVVFNNPGSTDLELNENGDPSVLFDNNNGTLLFFRFDNGEWKSDESPGMRNPDQGIFSFHHLGGNDPICTYIDSSEDHDHTFYFSLLRTEGWDRVEVFEWNGWRFPGGTDISETDGSIFIAFNDGLYLRVVRKEM